MRIQCRTEAGAESERFGQAGQRGVLQQHQKSGAQHRNPSLPAKRRSSVRWRHRAGKYFVAVLL